MPHYIIHIGPHKTASTYLQNCFAASRTQLARAGIVLAGMWDESPEKPSHTGLFHRLTNERRGELEPVFAAWREAGVPRVLISCEAIAALSLAPVQVQILRQLTQGSPVTLVYYVRRWSQLLASEWQQFVVQGFTLQLPEMLVHNLRDPLRSRAINIDLSLRVFADLFGSTSLRLVSYDSVVDSGTDLADHFARHFLDGASLVRPAGCHANASLPPAHIELLRQFNILDQQAGTAGNLHRFLTLRHAPAPMTRLLEHIARHEVGMQLSDDDSAVKDVLARNRATYASCAVGPVENEYFHAAKTVRVRFIRPDYLLAPGFAEEVRKLRKDLLAIHGS